MCKGASAWVLGVEDVGGPSLGARAGVHRGNECLRPGASERREAEVAVFVMCY